LLEGWGGGGEGGGGGNLVAGSAFGLGNNFMLKEGPEGERHGETTRGKRSVVSEGG